MILLPIEDCIRYTYMVSRKLIISHCSYLWEIIAAIRSRFLLVTRHWGEILSLVIPSNDFHMLHPPRFDGPMREWWVGSSTMATILMILSLPWLVQRIRDTILRPIQSLIGWDNELILDHLAYNSFYRMRCYLVTYVNADFWVLQKRSNVMR